MISNSYKPSVVVERMRWNGLNLQKGSIFGITEENVWFTSDLTQRIEDKAFAVLTSKCAKDWIFQWVSSDVPLYQYLLTGYQMKCSLESQDKKVLKAYREKINLIKTKKVATSTTSKDYVRVSNVGSLDGTCHVALRKFHWKGFTLRRGHIFGKFEKNCWYVSGLVRRNSDKKLSIYFSYNQNDWIQDWINPDSALHNLIYLGKNVRDLYGIYRVEIYDDDNDKAEPKYAKQNLDSITHSYHGIATGGLVRPK